ncbi:MYND finger, partial [Colletotrichum scovillei]
MRPLPSRLVLRHRLPEGPSEDPQGFVQESWGEGSYQCLGPCDEQIPVFTTFTM